MRTLPPHRPSPRAFPVPGSFLLFFSVSVRYRCSVCRFSPVFRRCSPVSPGAFSVFYAPLSVFCPKKQKAPRQTHLCRGAFFLNIYCFPGSLSKKSPAVRRGIGFYLHFAASCFLRSCAGICPSASFCQLLNTARRSMPLALSFSEGCSMVITRLNKTPTPVSMMRAMV